MIYNKLKELRTERGWRQKDVAEKLGISVQVYGNYENWINRPDPEMLCKMADLFGVTVDYILGREDETGGTGGTSWNGTVLASKQIISKHGCDADKHSQAEKALNELLGMPDQEEQEEPNGTKAQLVAVIDELNEEQRQLLLEVARQMIKK